MFDKIIKQEKAMKRKIISCLLMVTLSLGLVACGADDTTDTSGSAGTDTGANDTSDSSDDTSDDTSDEVAEVVYPDLGGVEIKVWRAMHGLAEAMDPSADNFNVVAAEMKEIIEERYNCVLVPVSLSGADGLNDAEMLIADFASGTPFADIVQLDNGTIMPAIVNGFLEDMTGQLGDLKLPSNYIDAATLNGVNYGITLGSPSCEMLAYDRALFEEIGMEKTPTDMFMEGNWDYESFKAYLVELKAKLPDDVYPIGHYPFHWAWAAAAANGTALVGYDLQVNYTDPAVIEGVELYQELLAEGLAAPPVIGTNEDTGLPTYSWNYQYNDTRIAIGRMEPWQAEYESDIEYGVTFMPWGSNVTLGTEGDYTSLSSAYSTGSVWCVINSVLKGAPSGVDPAILMQICLDYDNEYNSNLYTNLWEDEQNGEYVYITTQAGQARNFNTAEDVELYDWATTRNRTDFAWVLNSADLLSAWVPFRDIFGENLDARSTLESYEQEGVAKMNEAGFTQY